MKLNASSPSGSTYLLVPILLLFALLIVAVIRSPSLISGTGIGSALIVAAPLVLATYALMVVAIAGRGTVDLSVGPLLGFINVTLVQLHGADLVSSPLAVFAYVIAAGVAYQLVMGLIIIYVRVQPIIVALSGYLALSGINLVIMPRPSGTAPDWMMSWGAGTSIFSPVLVIVVLSTAAWLVFARSAFCGHLRMMGFDERAAYTSGVRINAVRLGAHCIAGVFSGLAALTVTSLIGSGDPTQGTTYTLIAVTALVLGGTSLAGGRGGAIGSLIGALNLFLIGYVLATFNFGGIQGFVTEMAYGLILVLSFLLSVALPYLQRHIRHVSPFLVFVALSMLFTAVMLHAKYDYGQPANVQESTASFPADERASSAFFFELGESASDFAMSANQKSMALAALLLVSVVFILRVSVAEAKTRLMTPFMYVSLLIIILVVIWLLATSNGHAAQSFASAKKQAWMIAVGA
ncbi:MAG: ABC transporter permease [Desulfobacterales bacterium]|nr:MAG: ABC transporter permease [Desulfobacterales bacterium]